MYILALHQFLISAGAIDFAHFYCNTSYCLIQKETKLNGSYYQCCCNQSDCNRWSQVYFEPPTVSSVMSSSTFKSSSTIRSSSAFRSSSTFRSSSIIGIIISSSQSSVVPTISTSKNYCLRNNSYSCEMMNVFSIRRNASRVWFSIIVYTAGVFSASPHHFLYSEEESQEIPTREYNSNASSTCKRMRRICSYYLN